MVIWEPPLLQPPFFFFHVEGFLVKGEQIPFCVFFRGEGGADLFSPERREGSEGKIAVLTTGVPGASQIVIAGSLTHPPPSSFSPRIPQESTLKYYNLGIGIGKHSSQLIHSGEGKPN